MSHRPVAPAAAPPPPWALSPAGSPPRPLLALFASLALLGACAGQPAPEAGTEQQALGVATLKVSASRGGQISLGGGRTVAAGTTATFSYALGSVLTLTATPGSGVDLVGWTGPCTGAGGACSLTLSQSTSVSAIFGAAITLSKAGAGSGTVTSGDGTLRCGTTCSAAIIPGVTELLIATPDANSTFAGWAGACDGSTNRFCSFQVQGARSITATFEPKKVALSVAASRGGQVTVSPLGVTVAAGTTYRGYVPQGSAVTLTAEAAAGLTFQGWSGACSGTDLTCVLSPTQATSVSASFVAVLTVSRAGSGTGRVTAPAGALDCGSACSASFTPGTSVVLTATANAGTLFTGWSAPCAGSRAQNCVVSLDASRTVSATFWDLTGSATPSPTVAGGGTGTIQSQDQLTAASVPMFVEPMPTFANSRIDGTQPVTVDMQETRQKILPESFYATLPEPHNQGSLVWGYNVNGRGASWPGVTIEARKGHETVVTYRNQLQLPDGSPPLLQRLLAVDLTLKWADPIGVSAINGCVQGAETGGLSGDVVGSTQQAFDPNGPCAFPYMGPVPTVPHFHGGEVPSQYDGHPQAWFTAGLGITGPSFQSNVYRYPNKQEASTLWIHDHSLGTTRLNVFSGMALFYWLRDERDTGLGDNPMGLPSGNYEHELLIADRIFDTNGQLLFPNGSASADGNVNGFEGGPANPNLHPFAIPEFFGNVITVNGKSWPYLEVEPRRYRFRVVDGSNSRFYSMQLFEEDQRSDGTWTGLASNLTDPSGVGRPGPHIWQIGSDGGFLNHPTDVDAEVSPDNSALLNTNPNPPHLFMAPGERADIIIDFSGMAGKRLILTNKAASPFPNGGASGEPLPGAAGEPQTQYDTASQILEFRVGTTATADPTTNFASTAVSLRSSPIVDLRSKASSHPDVRRQLVMDEVAGVASDAPVEVMLNNSEWDGRRQGSTAPIPGSADNGRGLYATETPQVGATEIWEIANMTADAHPIHLHLVQFQIIEVQPFLTEHGLCDQFSTSAQDFTSAQEYRPAWDALFPGGTYNGFTFAPEQFIPGYGPPNAYGLPNADGAVGGNLAFSTVLNGVSSAFVGSPIAPAARDAGWKDTAKVFPCAVTRLAVRFAPTTEGASVTRPGKNSFPFDPTKGGPGYAWHCHIIDHEDNEMMRPMLMSR